MKKWFLHILFLAGLFGVLTTSCSQETDDPTQETPKAQVVFTIALNGSSAASRGTWGDNYNNNNTNNYESVIGDEFENRINPDQFHVQLIIGNQTIDVENLEYKKTAQINEYEFIGYVPVNKAPTKFKIMVYANMDPVNGSYENAKFGLNEDYIPMFGVQSHQNLTLAPGNRTVLPDPIYLLRAMAKVEVELAANVINEGYTLTALTLDKYNKEGYCLPNNYASVDNTTSLCYPDDINNNTDTPSCFRVKADANASNTTLQPLSFTITDNHLVYYLPEVQNSTIGNGDLTMTLTLMKGNEIVKINNELPKLYFKHYKVGGTPFDVVRNHWYQYTITNIKTEFDLGLNYTVKMWNDIKKGILTFGDESGAVLTPKNEEQEEE